MIPLADTATPAARAALAQASELHPARSRASDGLLPSPEHIAENPQSDHNDGYAFDLTHDPAHGVDCNAMSRQLAAEARAGREPRAKYIIWNREINSASWGWSEWRRYTGANPHTKHMHVSIPHGRGHDVRPWWDFPEGDDDMDQATFTKYLRDALEDPVVARRIAAAAGSAAAGRGANRMTLAEAAVTLANKARGR